MLHSFLKTRFYVMILISCLLAISLFSAQDVYALDDTYTVNDTGDAADFNPGDGICETGFGNSICTLRAAIEEHEADGNTTDDDTIDFSIGTGAQTITVMSALPTLNGRITVDGTTQPGGATCSGPDLLITVSGDGGTYASFELAGDNSSIQGLVIIDFDAAGITVSGDSNTVRCNIIGANNATDTPLGNNDGVVVSGSSNTVGGAATTDRNVISGNNTNGVVVTGTDATITNNYIGLAKDGSTALGNTGDGVQLQSTDAAVSNNIIAENTGAGVRVDTGTGNSITDNNSIFDNGAAPIILQSGGNNSQTAPIFIYATDSQIKFTFQGISGQTYRFELYSDDVQDEAQTYQGSKAFGADGTVQTFTVNPGDMDDGTISMNVGDYAVLTATRLTTGDTSALSAAEQIVNPPSFVFTPGGAGLPDALTGQAYNQIISITGGTQPYTITSASVAPECSWVTFPAFPLTGTSVTLTGTAPGTPPATSCTFTLNLEDADTFPGSENFTLDVVNSPVVLADPTPGPVTVGPPDVLPSAVANFAYGAQTWTASGGSGSITITAVSGDLPNGTLDFAAGVLSGTPTTAGTINLTVTATDDNDGSNTDSKTYTLTVEPELQLTPPALPDGSANFAYGSHTWTTVGGVSPLTFGIVNTPTGLTFTDNGNGTATLSGTPTAAATFNVQVTVTDDEGNSVTDTQSVTINSQLQLTPPTLPDGSVNFAYGTHTWTATGGVNPLTFGIVNTPTGLTFTDNGNGTATLSGTPTAAATFNVQVTVTDDEGNSVTDTQSVTINPQLQLTPPTLPDGSVNFAYGTHTWTATGGVNPLTFGIVNTPTGLTFTDNGNGTATLSGTPTAAATFNVQVTVTDDEGNSVTDTQSVTINSQLQLTSPALPDGSVNFAYGTHTWTATGGVNPLTFGIVNTPTGLTFTDNGNGTATLSGTPTGTGTFNVQVTVTDSQGATAVDNQTVTINPELQLTAPTLPDGAVGSNYGSHTWTATGGVNPVSFGIVNTPTGLTFTDNGNGTATLSGTPTGTGTFNVQVTVTDSQGDTATDTQSVTITTAMALTPPVLPDGIQGQNYGTHTWTTSGGVNPLTFAIVNTPTGLSFVDNGNGTATLSGTPTGSGTFNVQVTVTDDTGASIIDTQSVTINPPLSLPPANAGTQALNGGAVSSPYSNTSVDAVSIEATGGDGNYTYSIISGALPIGTGGDPFTFNTANGDITGTPALADLGTSVFEVRVTDGTGAIADQRFSIEILAELAIILGGDGVLADAKIGDAYNDPDIDAVNGLAPYTFALVTPLGVGESFPTGLTLQANGDITGTPTDVGQVGANSFRVRVTDANGATDEDTFTINLNGADLALPAAGLPLGSVGQLYSSGAAIQASGGTGNYAYTFLGNPFVGLTMNAATGEITGTPVANDAGSTIFNVQVQDTVTNDTVIQTFSMFIYQELVLNNAILSNATIGVAYNETGISASGGRTPYTYSATGLPAGLSMNATNAAITGTVTGAAGTYNVNVTVTDDLSVTAMRTYTLEVVDAVMLPPFVSQVTPPSGNENVAYTFTFTPTGGSAPYAFNVPSGTLPPGLTLNSATGTLSGTPTATGTYVFSIRVVESGSSEDTETYTLSILSQNVQLTSPTSMSGGVVGDPYPNVTIQGLGGVAPYTYTVNNPPPGITCTNCNVATPGTAQLTGTPTTAGSYNVQITVTDSTAGIPTTDSQTFNVVIQATANLTLDTGNLNNGNTGVTYSGSVGASGGTAPYTFAVTGGTFPPGLTLNPDGTITGTPTTVGNYTFDITITDANGNMGTSSASIEITTVNMQLSPTTLPDFVVGQNANVTIQASGGQAPYTYTIIQNQFLGGLTFNNAGDPAFVTGTPTQPATYTVTIRATDANGNTVDRTYTVNMVAAPQLSVQPGTLPAGIVGQNYPATTITAVGSNETYTLILNSGTLPPGLSFNTTSGIIGGVPTTAGTYSFSIRATFQTVGTVLRTYTVRITTDNQVRVGSEPAGGGTIDFGEVNIGETATRPLTISETGANSVTISAVAISGEHAADFTITENSPPFTIVDGGAPITITLQCEPAAEGTRTATLTLTTNDQTSTTLTYSLTCTGIQLIVGDVVITRPETADGVPVIGAIGQVVQVRGLALRSGPYLGATMLGVLRPERDYLILAYNDTEGNANGEGPYAWYLLIDTFNNDRIGWASGRYMEIIGNVPFQDTVFDNSPTAPYNNVELVIRGNSNVRLRPSERSREVTPPTDFGVRVKAYAKTMQGGFVQWILIEHQGVRGWVKYIPETMEVAQPGLYGLDALPVW